MSSLHRRSESGVALVAVMMILAMLMGLAVALNTSTNMDTALRGAYQRTTTGFYAAESGLNRGMGDYRNIFLNFNVPTGSDFAAHSISIGSRNVNYQISDVTAYVSGAAPVIIIPPGQLFGGLNSQEYDYIANSTASSSSDVEARVNAEFKVGYIPIFQFVAFYKKDLEIAPGRDMNLHGRVHTNGDLYLSADNASLTISDTATNPNVQVSAKGDMYRGRKRANSCDNPGTVTVDKLEDLASPFQPTAGYLDPLGLNCTGAPSTPAGVSSAGGTRKVPTAEVAQWKGSMASQLESISVPDPDIAARGSGVYWTKADLRIVLNLDNTLVGSVPPNQFTIEVQNAAGTQDVAKTALLTAFMATNSSFGPANSTRPLFYTDRPILGGAAGCNCDDGHVAAFGCFNATAVCYSPAFASDNRVYGTGTTMVATGATDYRRGGFYNFRERKWMYLLNLDVRDLLAYNQTLPSNGRFFDPADRTDGGIVLFLSVQGPESGLASNRYGVRIFGSNTLPFPAMGSDPTGITVVSDQAVYVQGDYNSFATIAAGKQPAAILGDSINVLSNNWWAAAANPGAGVHTNDRQSIDDNGSGNRNATATTINTAFLGGVDETTPNGGTATYNGGLENYPRFNENWGNINFNYLGSFVSLGNPQHVTGLWNNQMYSPPLRNWDYDAEFNNAANLPPLSPRFVYVQQVLFTEEFK
ncbi:MAG: pilus assembly PilX N-terminal domain-containing protein [Deltaproteobacteria bacterium]|nr:pilus assembly PilX N-terminal domain-containing protein [Deltaproteobacteria bacterium]MBI3389280.1 pilus assembly PilX N-terminal domain-containing protein [Deltaproteobacteria bacterium]